VVDVAPLVGEDAAPAGADVSGNGAGPASAAEGSGNGAGQPLTESELFGDAEADEEAEEDEEDEG
jgi:hypothetical protein